MGTSKRYADYYDRQAAARPQDARSTIPVPQGAFGPNEIVWVMGSKPPVWAWIPWHEGPMTRVAGFAYGWNDRVVAVEWSEPVGGTRTIIVWRNAVTKRSA